MMSICTTTQMGVYRLLGLALVLFISPVMNAQQQHEIDPIGEFATQALADYVQNMVTDRNVGSLGFEDLGEARSAHVGEPYKMTFVGLGDLKGYATDQPATSVIRDSNSFWYPVLVEGQTRAKLEVLQLGGELIAGEFGATKTALAVAEATERLPEVISVNNINEPYTVTLMKISVLNASFIHIASADGDYLVPAMMDPQRYELERGQAYRADVVLARLKEIATEIDENKLM